MGKFTKLHSIESAIWAAVVFVFFIYSFEFDKDIEIYKFGAAGWPRAVLGMLALVMIGNIWHQVRHGSQAQVGRVGVTDDDMDNVDRSFWFTRDNCCIFIVTINLCMAIKACWVLLSYTIFHCCHHTIARGAPF